MAADGAVAASVEAELEELNRRFKIMEGDRKAYADEVQVGHARERRRREMRTRARACSAARVTRVPACAARPRAAQNVLKKQKSHIDKLQKENLSLKQELSLETRAAAMGGEVRLSSQINKMTDLGDQFARKIELERQRGVQLDKQNEQLREQLLRQRQAMGGIHAPTEADHAVERQVAVLENRLDKALVKFNESIAHNKELREQIDNLRRERLVFDSLYKKLQRELGEKKRSMAEVIEAANVAYEERDRLQASAARVRQTSEREQREFEAEWKALGDTLDEDLKVHEAMSRDLQARFEGNAVPETELRGQLTLDDEQQLKRQVRRANWGLAKDKASIHANIEKVHSYEDAFEKIQEATGITDIEELVSQFIEGEEQNFSRFNYLNELSAEVDKGAEALLELRAEIERYKGLDQGVDTQRHKHVKELELRVRAAEARAESLDERWRSHTSLIGTLGERIEALCARIGCNMAFLREVGGEEGVTESNMMVYLGVIEQRTNELLRAFGARSAEGARRAASAERARGSDVLVDEGGRTFLTALHHAGSAHPGMRVRARGGRGAREAWPAPHAGAHARCRPAPPPSASAAGQRRARRPPRAHRSDVRHGDRRAHDQRGGRGRRRRRRRAAALARRAQGAPRRTACGCGRPCAAGKARSAEAARSRPLTRAHPRGCRYAVRRRGACADSRDELARSTVGPTRRRAKGESSPREPHRTQQACRGSGLRAASSAVAGRLRQRRTPPNDARAESSAVRAY